MVMLPKVFNTGEHEPLGDFTPIAPGDYLAHITKTEIKSCGPNAKDPNGKYLSIRFDILDQKAKGRVIFANLNLINKNPQAVEIANKELRSICDAVGIVGAVSDTSVLHGKPLLLKLSIKEATERYPANNVIKGYGKANGTAASSSGPAGNPFEDDDDDDSNDAASAAAGDPHADFDDDIPF